MVVLLHKNVYVEKTLNKDNWQHFSKLINHLLHFSHSNFFILCGFLSLVMDFFLFINVNFIKYINK